MSEYVKVGIDRSLLYQDGEDYSPNLAVMILALYIFESYPKSWIMSIANPTQLLLFRFV